MRFKYSIVTILGVAAFSVAAFGAHVDIRPYLTDGKITAGAAELAGSTVVPVADHQQVFGAELGEDDPGQPFMSEDPGFLAEIGAFPGGAGKLIAWTALDGLKYWNGSGFGTVPSGESLQITKGSQSTNIASLLPAGFAFGTIHADGGLHEHMTFELLGADGNPIPGDGVEPAAGIYLLTLQLGTTMDGVAPSDPIWLVYNNGDTEENHDLAVEWVERHLAPEPAGLIGLMLAGAVLIRGARNRGARHAAA